MTIREDSEALENHAPLYFREFKPGDKVKCIDDDLRSINTSDGDQVREALGKSNRQPPSSKATGPNPKDIFGAMKVSMSKIPACALAHEAMAMGNGAEKYGAYNWRAKPVQASIYVDACMRHLLDWFEGQTNAKDSGVHHLGHARACLGILIDAEENNCLADDRPFRAGYEDNFDALLDRLSAAIKKSRAESTS